MENIYSLWIGRHPESNILDTEHSEIPDQHKCGHVLALDNGNYAVMPNNRILWSIPSFTTKHLYLIIKSKLQFGMLKIRDL
jgi:hypothetical protein